MSDASTAAPARLERCPNCNSRLPETPVSICPYCVFPLGTRTGETSVEGESPAHARILRVAEHAKYQETLAIVPPENREYQRGRLAIFRGKAALVVAVAVVALAALLVGGALAGYWLTWVGVAVAVLGVAWILKGRAACKRAVALPLLRRPSMILNRRSETEIRGWNGETTYYFELEFEDGTVAEFRYPGHGANEEPYTSNLPGVAFTRGTDLLLFKHIRV